MTDWFSYGRCRCDRADEPHEWLRARHQWWVDEAGDDSLEAYRSRPEAIAALEDGLVRAEEAILWFASGATERLHACWLAAVLPGHVRIRLAIPPPRWPSIGMFHSEFFAKTESQELSQAHRTEMAEIWTAFLEPAPRRFFALVDQRDPGHVGHGLSQFRNRFPSRIDGLTHWERELLRLIDKYRDQRVARAVTHLLGHSKSTDAQSDRVLMRWALELAHGGLLDATSEPDPERLAIFTTSFRCTELGHQVLAGQRNRVEIGGFDRWFGGTHNAAGNRWWIDGDAVARDD